MKLSAWIHLVQCLLVCQYLGKNEQDNGHEHEFNEFNYSLITFRILESIISSRWGYAIEYSWNRNGCSLQQSSRENLYSKRDVYSCIKKQFGFFGTIAEKTGQCFF